MSYHRVTLSLSLVVHAWLFCLWWGVSPPCTVAAFRGPLNLTLPRRRSRPQGSTTTTTCHATSVAHGQGLVERNIFHNSDKPLLLVGYSSAGHDQVARLAHALQASYLSAGQVVSLSDLTTAKEVDLKWPNILYLDLSQTVPNDLPTILGDWHAEAATLSVFVNVQESSSSTSSSNNKKEMEDTVLVPFTDYEICIQDEGQPGDVEGWNHIVWELARIVARARLIPPIPGDTERTNNCAHLSMGDHTFFLSLSFPKVTEAEEYIAEMCFDVDALEYRTDLLACRDSRFDLIYGMQLLRRYSRPHVVRVPGLPFGPTVLEDVMPIVYTVRTQNQAGTYPDDEAGIQRMFELLEWGLRAGVEVLDVESAWDAGLTKNLLDKAQARYSSQILGSHHVVGKEVSMEEAVLLFEQCALQGRAHAAKVVLSIDKEERDRMAYEAALISSELARADGEPDIPRISLILGEVGQFSRVINLPFTPVTHERLPVAAAPGQLTAMEIMTMRLFTKIFARKKYAILGHNIAYSVSPQMHGAAFRATKLPHEYIRVDVETVEKFIQSDLFKSDDFGGTSITIPHKQSIIPYVDVLSEAAKAIGSVNTLVVKEEYFAGNDGEDLDDPDESEGEFRRVIYGDNTDWKGIYNPLNRILGGSVQTNVDTCLILGAGGTARAAAFVANKLGLKIIYYNRTPEKAADLVSAFGGSLALSLEADGDDSLGSFLTNGSLKVVISTLPAAAEFELPPWLLEKQDKGQPLPVVFDVNYKPYHTKLLLQAEAAGCTVVRGSEMLWEQGVGQFELWTGRTAPYAVMKSAVLENCLPKEEEKD